MKSLITILLFISCQAVNIPDNVEDGKIFQRGNVIGIVYEGNIDTWEIRTQRGGYYELEPLNVAGTMGRLEINNGIALYRFSRVTSTGKYIEEVFIYFKIEWL